MAKPSQNRVDVSDIRLPKRLMRIGAGFAFGWSVLMALGLQIVTYEVGAVTGSWDLRFSADSEGFVVHRRPKNGPGWTGFNYRSFSSVMSNGEENVNRAPALRGRVFAGNRPESICLLPGVNLHADDFRPTENFAVTIHHFWPICISGVLFLATHAQSKRSARRADPLSSTTPKFP